MRGKTAQRESTNAVHFLGVNRKESTEHRRPYNQEQARQKRKEQPSPEPRLATRTSCAGPSEQIQKQNRRKQGGPRLNRPRLALKSNAIDQTEGEELGKSPVS